MARPTAALAAAVAARSPVAAQAGVLRLYIARPRRDRLERAEEGHRDDRRGAERDGRAQASLLHDTLRGVSLDAVYCSTLSRSIETARVAVPTIPATRLADLAEQNQGRFQGGPNDTPEFLSGTLIPTTRSTAVNRSISSCAGAPRAGPHPAGAPVRQRPDVAQSIANKMVLGGCSISTSAARFE
jgi:hypothetical protein